MGPAPRPSEREYFELLGDGLVVVLAPEPAGPGAGRLGRSFAFAAVAPWLHVGVDRTVTAFTGKVDVGQDNRTALSLIVAEELGVAAEAVRLVMGDTDLCPFDIGHVRESLAAGRRRGSARLRRLRRGSCDRSPRTRRPASRRIELAMPDVPLLSGARRWRYYGRPAAARDRRDACDR